MCGASLCVSFYFVYIKIASVCLHGCALYLYWVCVFCANWNENEIHKSESNTETSVLNYPSCTFAVTQSAWRRFWWIWIFDCGYTYAPIRILYVLEPEIFRVKVFISTSRQPNILNIYVCLYTFPHSCSGTFTSYDENRHTLQRISHRIESTSTHFSFNISDSLALHVKWFILHHMNARVSNTSWYLWVEFISIHSVVVLRI